MITLEIIDLESSYLVCRFLVLSEGVLVMFVLGRSSDQVQDHSSKIRDI